MKRPTITCFVGSTRFCADEYKNEHGLTPWQEANLQETMAGKIVLTIGCDFKSDVALGLTLEDKQRLDELHLRKIDLADEILVINVNGYVGESTRNEINYARRHYKDILWWEMKVNS